MTVSLPSQALFPSQSIPQAPSPHATSQSAGHLPAPGGSTAQTSPSLSLPELDVPVPESLSVAGSSVVDDVGVGGSPGLVVPVTEALPIVEPPVVDDVVVVDPSGPLASLERESDTPPKLLAS